MPVRATMDGFAVRQLKGKLQIEFKKEFGIYIIGVVDLESYLIESTYCRCDLVDIDKRCERAPKQL